MGYLFGEYEIKENMVNYHKVINAAIATLATCAMLLPVAGSANADESSIPPYLVPAIRPPRFRIPKQGWAKTTVS